MFLQNHFFTHCVPPGNLFSKEEEKKSTCMDMDINYLHNYHHDHQPVRTSMYHLPVVNTPMGEEKS
jgi:hypothetical protein